MIFSARVIEYEVWCQSKAPYELFIGYQIQVKTLEGIWSLHKSQRELEELHQALLQELQAYPETTDLVFPILSTDLTEEMLQSNLYRLNQYLSSVLCIPHRLQEIEWFLSREEEMKDLWVHGDPEAKEYGARRQPRDRGVFSSNSNIHRFQIQIPGYELQEGVVVYEMLVQEYYSSSECLAWKVKRRYQEFRKFHKSNGSQLSFPPKLYSKGQQELELRRQQLEVYMQETATLYQSPELFSFLDLDNPNRVILSLD